MFQAWEFKSERMKLPASASRHADILPDGELIARVRAGDQVAFDMIMRQHATVLLRMAYGYLKSTTDAEDLVQDLFLALWQGRETWQVQGTIGSYLAVAVRRRSLDILKHRRVESTHASRVSEHLVHQMETGMPIPADIALSIRDDQSAVRQLINRLPDRTRLVLLLRYGQQHSIPEIAAILGISAAATRQLIWRALDQLRRQFRA